MLEIRVTKEIRDFEPKVIGPFTFRQLICLGIGSPIVYFILKYFSPLVTVDIAAFLCFPVAAIAYLIGWYEPYGMKTEKFIRSIFINRILAPAHRKYKTVNTHEALIQELAELETYLSDSPVPEVSETGQKPTHRKRYILSPKAYR